VTDLNGACPGYLATGSHATVPWISFGQIIKRKVRNYSQMPLIAIASSVNPARWSATNDWVRIMSSVSVVIPCYNYGHFLRDAVRSVLSGQDGVDVRVLVIDDASTDDSVVVAKALAEEDSRIEIAVHGVNRGNIATYNEGILEWADGDYTVLLSADDRLTPGSLLRAVQLLDTNQRVGFAYGHHLNVREGEPLPIPRTEVQGWSIWPGRWWIERRFRSSVNCITSPEVVVRTSLQKKVGGYDTRLPHTADLEIWMRLAAHADVGYVRGVDQAFYRLHGQNMTAGRNKVVDLRQRQAAFDALLETCGGRLTDPGHLYQTVHRKLSWEAIWRASRAYDRGRTDHVPVDELVAFGLSCWPAITRTSVYRGLRFRQAVGPRWMPYLQPFIWSAVIRKISNTIWWRTWERYGI
jgi:glycosyltransferase involved in cell wall biosynthesis